MSAISIASRLLTKDAGVLAITNNVYPVEAPQGAATPYLVIGIVSDLDELLLQGAGMYQRTRLSVEAVADNATTALDLDTAAFSVLRNIIKQKVTTSSGRYIDVDINYANVAITGSSLNQQNMIAMRQYLVRWRAA